jgi:hypothetical protein
LTDAKTIPLTGAANPIGLLGKVANDLKGWKANHDRELPTKFASGNAVVTFPANSESAVSGNYTIAVTLASNGLTYTTANLAFNANAATVQTALDTALSSAPAYNAGDIDVACTNNLNSSNMTLTGTANSYTERYFTAVTANVNLGVNSLVTAVLTTVGQIRRPWLAALEAMGIIGPTGTVTPYQRQPVQSEWASLGLAGNNPFSINPATAQALVAECAASEGSDTYRTIFIALVPSLRSN